MKNTPTESDQNICGCTVERRKSWIRISLTSTLLASLISTVAEIPVFAFNKYQGATWRKSPGMGPLKSTVTSFEFSLLDPSTIFAATNAGMFKTQNAGRNWVFINSGLNAAQVSKLAISRSGTLYAGTPFNGLFKSTDLGQKWKLVHGLPGTAILSLQTDPNNHKILYTSVNSFNESDPGLSRSEDGGDTWDCGLYPETIPTDMGIDPSNPQTIYIGGYDGGPPFGGVDGLFKSMDSGLTWSMIMNGLPQQSILALAIDPVNNATIYVSLRNGVFKSIDGGNNWTPFNSGLGSILVSKLLVDPNNPNRVYAGTSFGVFSIDQAP